MLAIPAWGIVGVAIVFAFCKLFLTVAQFLIVLIKFRFSPFTNQIVVLLAISAMTWVIFQFTPFPFTPVLNIIVRSFATGAFFTLIIYKLKISPDINALIDTVLKGLFNIKLHP